MGEARLSFSALQFEISGVVAAAKGAYGSRSETIDFTEDVKLQAHVSEAMTGSKRVLLKPIDPLMARHGAGTYLPINVCGVRDRPKVKLDLKRVF